jgi:hypothetical protein
MKTTKCDRCFVTLDVLEVNPKWHRKTEQFRCEQRSCIKRYATRQRRRNGKPYTRMMVLPHQRMDWELEA